MAAQRGVIDLLVLCNAPTRELFGMVQFLRTTACCGFPVPCFELLRARAVFCAVVERFTVLSFASNEPCGKHVLVRIFSNEILVLNG